MTDRELLEAAAKAEGHNVVFNEASGLCHIGNEFSGIVWNPLYNDGDALRLAVKLNLRIDGYDGQVEVMDGCPPYKIGRETFTNTFVRIEEVADDKMAATRRAIVRAAAMTIGIAA